MNRYMLVGLSGGTVIGLVVAGVLVGLSAPLPVVLVLTAVATFAGCEVSARLFGGDA